MFQPRFNTFDLLTEAASRWGDRVALIDRHGTLSYNQLLQKTEQLAAQIIAAGVERDTVIGISFSDAGNFLSALFGALKQGNVALPIDPALPNSERLRIAADSGATWSVSANGIERNLAVSPLDIRGAFPDAAVIRHTSGTTGRTKGVVISHRAIAERAQASAELLDIGEHDTVLSPLSLSYHFIASAITFIRQGAIILDTSTLSPADVVCAANKHKATKLYASPEVCSNLASIDQPIPSLTSAIATSSNLSLAVASHFRAIFGLRLTQVFGIIEVGLPIWNDQAELDPGLLGVCRAPYRHKVIDRNGDAVPPNQIGELLLGGPGFFSGYILGAERDIYHHCNEWFHTGDLVRQDGAGNIAFCGRKKSAIEIRGETIFPEAIESVLREADNIALVRVRAADNSTLMAEITLKNGARETPHEWRLLCQSRLSQKHVPEVFKVVAEIQLTGSGKIVRYDHF